MEDAPASRPGPEPGNGQRARMLDPREVARLTAAKIDEIESQMIAGVPAARPQPGTVALPLRPAQANQAGTVFIPSRARAAEPAVPLDGGALVAGAAAPSPAPVTRIDAAAFVGADAHGVAADVPVIDTAPLRPGADGRDGAARPVAQSTTSRVVSAAEIGGAALEVIVDAAAGVEIANSELPPIFEEAAVLYSNGQSGPAAAGLWQAVRGDTLGAHSRQGWSMLFDLYQLTGREADFEKLALEYSARYETSPPTWDPSLAPADAGSRPAPAPATVVALSAALDAQAVRQIEQLQRAAQRNRAVTLDLSPVKSIDPLGADLLTRVLVAFRKSDRELHVTGAESLHDLLLPTLESGRREPGEACWLLLLELQRLLARQHDFEDWAIEYCVTFEVSPPSWEPMPPNVSCLAKPAQAAATGRPRSCEATDDALVVRGEIEGSAQDLLAGLRAYLAERASAVLDCRHLRRIDFVAAGELLNEVVALQGAGKYLVFKDANHLVAALMAVMGIRDLAEVRLRRS